ncbi:MAG: dipeptide ABC transporter ATP-binding protein [Candidatus Thiodiazotropha taylori]|uniref:Dipeptide ABC transporter ATP-binding protein n=1 Tax=Candidatus Thiodiazotropha taylori TaxID=2792791 RepID=A0A9E4KAM5_9GAMM|nr:dipeptide ABC transporter ATP-binding protein [Candidatus Thiodiazotropha taylori]MCG8050634.1 dipeptide ABC transporter ATP-binding protein [Candidatus Thiodiazotropha taylori]MCG8055738.1 dipeptide ABC transporter ATP-binding protein [Candidatus Thiodiazotropha taylori]MCW4256055.1 dipeptide ABC transporter ATP-binding protein [Candidatus Thiodiazotropha taylori]MCW4312453.1 dipeptide ABC transporter ATP-binding protein [Candidatus Thiodiazotropha taylori]
MLLSVKALHTWFKHQPEPIKAVDGIDFEIERGETFCLVGESGSGKSITALSIMRLLPQSGLQKQNGQVLFKSGQGDAVDLSELKESKMREIRGGRIAMIFQEPMSSLNPVFTIGEQILEAVKLHFPQLSASEAWDRVMKALTDVQLPDPETRVNSYPHQLSGGQRQRVMIAMAMACEPDLLIADEPTTALDVTVQREILRLMKALQQRTGMAILFITHDFGVVSEIADRVGVMQQGKLVETGTTDQIIHKPEHLYTQSLIAALPENLARHETHQVVQDQPPLIRLNDLAIHFPVRKGLLRRVVDQVRAVDGVDLEIPRGQILALVGESGSGKTTLGRGILRLTEPTAGQITFDNTDITGMKPAQLRQFRRNMQIIFQDPISSLNPRLSIAAILTEPMKVHGIGENREERIELARDLLQQVQMEEDALWRYPHEFSGGQRQRIGIARALSLEPSFIVCDEITSALDVSVQAEILKMLLELRRQHNLTLLFITHNIGVVEYVSDRTAVMYQGQIVEQGRTEDIVNNPQNDYTQQLIAAVPRVPL